MKTYFLHLLIDSRIEELDVSICRASANKDSVMNLIAIRCQVCEYLSQSSLDIIYGILFETSFDDAILPPHLLHDFHERDGNISVLETKAFKYCVVQPSTTTHAC